MDQSRDCGRCDANNPKFTVARQSHVLRTFSGCENHPGKSTRHDKVINGDQILSGNTSGSTTSLICGLARKMCDRGRKTRKQISPAVMSPAQRRDRFNYRHRSVAGAARDRHSYARQCRVSSDRLHVTALVASAPGSDCTQYRIITRPVAIAASTSQHPLGLHQSDCADQSFHRRF